jgi:hypothetical protein
MWDAQATFLSESTPITLECLQNNWETFAKTSKFAPVKHGIEKGLEKLRKWYMATDQSNMYFICLGEQHLELLFIPESHVMYQVLEPSIKLKYAKQKWEKDTYNWGVAALKKVVCSFINLSLHCTNGVISLMNTMYLLHSLRSLTPLLALL